MFKKIKLKHWLELGSILLLAIIMTLPVAVGNTYAGTPEAPDAVVAYSTGSLDWNVETDETGTARIDMFEAYYNNVAIGEDKPIIAPGTESSCLLRLRNDENTVIYYTLTYWYDGCDEKQTVQGRLTGNQYHNINLNWSWPFEVNDATNQKDTALGTLAAEEDVDIGMHVQIEVEDSGEPDTSKVKAETWFVLMIAASITVILLLVALAYVAYEKKHPLPWKNKK